MQMADGEDAGVQASSASVDSSQEVLLGSLEPQRDGDSEEVATAPAEAPSNIEQKQGTPKIISKASAAPRDVEPEWAVFPESNYSFEADSTLGNKWGSGSEEELLKKRQEAYLREGTRRSVAAIFLVHRAEYPHVLLLLDQQQQKHSLLMFKYKTWQKPREVLHAKLTKYLIKPEQNSKRKWVAQQLSNDGPDMEVGEFLGEWWRGDFDDQLVPYLPPHVTRPKERVRVHQVQLPHRCSFRIPTGFCLTVVPIFELSCERVGLAISGLSHLLARFSIRLMVPTLDKFEAETSMESKTEQETEGIRAELNDTPARPEGPGMQAGTQPTPHREEDLELLPPELQHLAELEEVD